MTHKLVFTSGNRSRSTMHPTGPAAINAMLRMLNQCARGNYAISTDRPNVFAIHNAEHRPIGTATISRAN